MIPLKLTKLCKLTPNMENNMKKISLILIMIGLIPLLQACASGFKERTAPCPPTASLSSNPCNPLPINMAESSIEEILNILI